jgi:hypothetical protein
MMTSIGISELVGIFEEVSHQGPNSSLQFLGQKFQTLVAISEPLLTSLMKYCTHIQNPFGVGISHPYPYQNF